MEAPDKIYASFNKGGSIALCRLKHSDAYMDTWGSMIGPHKFVRSSLVPQWQPIETAPRDGTWVMVTGYEMPQKGDHYTSIGDWSAEGEAPVCVVAQFSDEGEDYTYWRFCSYDSGIYGDAIRSPTHWMSLPKPPEGV